MPTLPVTRQDWDVLVSNNQIMINTIAELKWVVVLLNIFCYIYMCDVDWVVLIIWYFVFMLYLSSATYFRLMGNTSRIHAESWEQSVLTLGSQISSAYT